MSEVEKIFASIAGTLAGHVLLLAIVFLFFAVGRAPVDAISGGAARPGEVTVMLSEVFEQLEKIEPEAEEPDPEPVVPEPEPAVPPPPGQRAYVDTAMNTPSQVKPENARFESDRNTIAATELLPDPSQPQEEGPTLDGTNPLPHLTLQDRDFTDGELNEPPASQPSSAADSPPAPAQRQPAGDRRNPEETDPELPPEEEAREGEDEERNEAEAEADSPPERVADEVTRPEADLGEENREAESERSFVDQSAPAGSMAIAENMGEEDREATVDREATQVGNAADPEPRKEKASTVEELASMNEEEIRQLADQSIFGAGFSPEERQNKVNGTLSNRGQNSVDAEETVIMPEGAVRLIPCP